MKELPHTHSCFVCGESNPLGLKLRFRTDGHIVQTRFRHRTEHIGFKNVVHGGLIATVLDEIMVWACAVQTGQFAYCAELKVRFLKPLPPGEEVVVTSELTANRKGRIFEAEASARNSHGQTLAEATGKYLPLKAADLTPMAADLVGDASWVLGQPHGSSKVKAQGKLKHSNFNDPRLRPPRAEAVWNLNVGYLFEL